MAIIASTKFQLEDRWVPFGRAKLETDHISLVGLGFRKKIKLSEIDEMYWQADLIMLRFAENSVLELIIESAALWRYELQALCGLVDADSKMGMFMRSVREDALELSAPASGDGLKVGSIQIAGDGAAVPVELEVTPVQKKAAKKSPKKSAKKRAKKVMPRPLTAPSGDGR